MGQKNSENLPKKKKSGGKDSVGFYILFKLGEVQWTLGTSDFDAQMYGIKI
jgi:hypothetical protein